jgi:hypothetical protein
MFDKKVAENCYKYRKKKEKNNPSRYGNCKYLHKFPPIPMIRGHE